MNEIIKNYRDECTILRKKTEENDKKIRELLTNPMVSEFFRIYSENIKLKEKLSGKEQRLSYFEMSECQHTFIITGTEKEWESGRIIKTPIYHCIKCGLTNEYDVKDINDLVDGIKSQMGYIFADTSKNGTVLYNQIISLEDALEAYKKIITMNPNITDDELKNIFPNSLAEIQTVKEKSDPILAKKLTPPNNTENK